MPPPPPLPLPLVTAVDLRCRPSLSVRRWTSPEVGTYKGRHGTLTVTTSPAPSQGSALVEMLQVVGAAKERLRQTPDDRPADDEVLPRGALLVGTRPQRRGGGGGPSTDPKIVVRNNVLCRRRRRRRFCFRHRAGGNFFVRPYVSVLKILRISWRTQKWLKSTKKRILTLTRPPGRTLADGSLS